MQLTASPAAGSILIMNRAFDLHIRGGTVMPMTDEMDAFDGDLLIRHGRIAEITRGRAVDVDAKETIDASDGLVLPGFVQCHVHVVQSLLRHQADGVELLEWLQRFTWPYEAALDADDVEAAAELGIAELLCGGTTTVLDFGSNNHHDRVFRAADRLGIRFLSGKSHMDIGDGVPDALLEDRDRSLAEAQQIGTRWNGAANGRLGYSVCPRFALSCSQELLTECAQLARSNGWLLQSHANENIRETEEIRRRTGMGNIEYFHDVGLTGDDVILAHGVHLEQKEMDLLARTNTRICHCPGTNLKLASGIADVRRLIDLGIPVALGSDGAPCNNRLSIFHEMSLAATLHSLRHGPEALSASTVLSMATRGGAAALHIDRLVGTLEQGKAADVVVVGCEGWSMLPDGDPSSRIVFGATARDVRQVIVDGRIVVSNGRLATERPAEIRRRSRHAWQAVRDRMEQQSW
jgi:cytosine/adenosine deaminase-related metal-dependent hydrolase